MVEQSLAKTRVIRSYKSWVIRSYCTIRFLIMNIRILDEIEQYLPIHGRILDIGCGFGLFSLYYALLSPERNFTSLDISPSRIAAARSTAESLNLSAQITFENRGAETLSAQPVACDAAYMLDLVHHLPEAMHRPLLNAIFQHLVPGGILILKDIATTPSWKVVFTWLLDMLMSPHQPPNYVDTANMRAMLENAGFDVKIHNMLDILPYPHVLYVCRKDKIPQHDLQA